MHTPFQAAPRTRFRSTTTGHRPHSACVWLRLAAHALLCLLSCHLGALAARADRPGAAPPPEPAPTFRASDLLVADVIEGPNYKIDEFVQVEKYKYLFQLHTEWGIIPAHGMNMLELRLREMYAIENVKQLAGDPQFAKGVCDGVKNTGVKILLTEPQGANLRPTLGKSDTSARRAGSATRRRLAVEVGCDPETTNPVLKALLDAVAMHRELGQLATKTGCTLSVPRLALLPATAEIKELLVSKSSEEISARIEADLCDLEMLPRDREKFSREVDYSTSQRLLFLHYLRPLKGIKGLHLLIKAAVEAGNEAEGLAVLRELKLLNELHQRDPVLEVTSSGLPLAHTQSGTLVIISSADYIANTPEVIEAVAAHRREFPERATTFYTGGKVSAQAKKTFAAARIQVVER